MSLMQELCPSPGDLFVPLLAPGWMFLLLWFPEGIFFSLAAILLGFRFPKSLSPNGSFLVIDGTTCKIKFLSVKTSLFPCRSYCGLQGGTSQTEKSLKAKERADKPLDGEGEGVMKRQRSCN